MATNFVAIIAEKSKIKAFSYSFQISFPFIINLFSFSSENGGKGRSKQEENISKDRDFANDAALLFEAILVRNFSPHFSTNFCLKFNSFRNFFFSGHKRTIWTRSSDFIP